ncbi:MAG: hypothetical protein KA144_03090 [Xanthomonadaceae bacterium]|nr:hypothetical protein [Xanthomonadaceae bacterium]
MAATKIDAAESVCLMERNDMTRLRIDGWMRTRMRHRHARIDVSTGDCGSIESVHCLFDSRPSFMLPLSEFEIARIDGGIVSATMLASIGTRRRRPPDGDSDEASQKFSVSIARMARRFERIHSALLML